MDSVAIPKRPNKRDLAKVAMRAKLLRVARQVFDAEGYDAATIRGIAAAAKVSTGSIFANWTSKDALFAEIFRDDAPALRVAETAYAAGTTRQWSEAAGFERAPFIHAAERLLISLGLQRAA